MTVYNYPSKLLHHIALSQPFLMQAMLDAELKFFGKDLPSAINGNHIFIAGLARSGTTVLLRALHATNKFASLTYRDMPFVMAPNAWSKVANLSIKTIEHNSRAHGDGIDIDFDSPEAMDEVFWRVFEGHSYINKKSLKLNSPEIDTIDLFKKYVALILHRYKKDRYLSKNNNNILRINAIVETFPNAKILIPFRRPLQQSFSLLKQHKLFCYSQQKDLFTERYMSWLVHHEFGNDHRPFEFGLNTKTQEPIHHINYWIFQWINAYSYLLSNYHNLSDRIIFVSYELLCEEKKAVWNNMSKLLSIQKTEIPLFEASISDIPGEYNLNLFAEAEDIYSRLNSLSRSMLM
jgi:hypothetical protein